MDMQIDHSTLVGCVKEGEMKRHVLCSTSVFSFSEQHITKLGKIQTYLRIQKDITTYKNYVQQAFFLFSVHITKLSKNTKLW